MYAPICAYWHVKFKKEVFRQIIGRSGGEIFCSGRENNQGFLRGVYPALSCLRLTHQQTSQAFLLSLCIICLTFSHHYLGKIGSDIDPR